MKRALISVSDKTGVTDFSKELVSLGYEIISTGGTEKALREAGIPTLNISDVTQFPECLDGRVKTLHPAIHAGLLARRDVKEHMEQLEKLDIQTIDLVVVNLYPFKQTILKEDVTQEEAIENIDIGGPTMLRSAAKNYQDVAVIIDPMDYEKVVAELKEAGEVSLDTKFYLCGKVFEHTSHYDTLIAKYIKQQRKDTSFPEALTLTYEKVQDMRYGENPHQKAVFYKEVGAQPGCLTDAVQLHGKELSYNNINDTNGALELLKEYEETTVVACKHANPCGVGSADTVVEAYKKAHDADPTSIFGGIVVTNGTLDAKTAEEINKIFVEIVVAPAYEADALEILKQKKNIRILELPSITVKRPKTAYDMKKVAGGLLVQEIDLELLEEDKLQYVTNRKPTEQEMKDLLFAWKVVKHAKSNGIALAKNLQTTGIGPGQVNRIWATKQSIEHAVEYFETAEGSVLASDAFFPFSDSVEEVAKAGITAIIQPGGSIRDQDSIDACNKYNIAMIFTGMRHFKH